MTVSLLQEMRPQAEAPVRQREAVTASDKWGSRVPADTAQEAAYTAGQTCASEESWGAHQEVS